MLFRSPANGGTGVANNAANTLTFTGNYSLGLTLTGATTLTLPTSGTVATIAGAQTLTNKRIVMRIGIVLTLSFNLPLRWIRAAHAKPLWQGSGDIALELKGEDRIAYLHLWPHARAWHIRQPQPALRCLPDAERVGQLLHKAWQERQSEIAE